MKTMVFRQRVRKTVIFISFLIFPATYYYFSPYLPFQGLTAGVINGSIMLFGGLFVSSLFFGRLFCSWLCPAGGLQECVAVFNPGTVKRKKIRWIKYVLWCFWIGFYLFLLFRIGAPERPDFFFQTEYGFSISNIGSLALYLIIAFVVMLIPLIIGRRASCHSICWMAPFMVLGRKLRNTAGWPSLRLSVRKDLCISCGRCSRDCPMSIDVMEKVKGGRMEDQDCILCGVCADNCPEGVITLGFSAG